MPECATQTAEVPLTETSCAVAAVRASPMANPTEDSRCVFFLRFVSGLCCFSMFCTLAFVAYMGAFAFATASASTSASPFANHLEEMLTGFTAMLGGMLPLQFWCAFFKELSASSLMLRWEAFIDNSFTGHAKVKRGLSVVLTFVVAPFLPLFEPVCARFGLMQPACFSALPTFTPRELRPQPYVPYVRPIPAELLTPARMPRAVWTVLEPYVRRASWANHLRRFHIALPEETPLFWLAVYAGLPVVVAAAAQRATLLFLPAIPVCGFLFVCFASTSLWGRNPHPTSALVWALLAVSDFASILTMAAFCLADRLALPASSEEPSDSNSSGAPNYAILAVWVAATFALYVGAVLVVAWRLAMKFNVETLGGMIVFALTFVTGVRTWHLASVIGALGMAATCESDFALLVDDMAQNAPPSARDRVRTAASKVLEDFKDEYPSLKVRGKGLVEIPRESVNTLAAYASQTSPAFWTAFVLISQLPAILFPVYIALSALYGGLLRAIAVVSVATGVSGLTIGIPRAVRLARLPQVDTEFARSDRAAYDVWLGKLFAAVSGLLVPVPAKALTHTVPPTVLPADVAEFVVGPFMHPEDSVNALSFEAAATLVHRCS